MSLDDVRAVSSAFIAECRGNIALLNALLERSKLPVDRFELALRELEQRGCLRRKLDFVVVASEHDSACLGCIADHECPARPLRAAGQSGVYARAAVGKGSVKSGALR